MAKKKFHIPKKPEWGKPVGDGRPLADSEIIPRLQDIKAQIGGSYAIDRAIEVLEGLSSVQPERKTGHWIINSDGYYPYCSECRMEPKSGDMTDFCPSCGADMRGE